MSKYLEDAQGKIVSNPINETNTKYTFTPTVDGVKNTGNGELDYQYLVNNEPVSDIDAEVHTAYRSTIEELRHKTERWYENLEKCLVPVPIEGMAFQPFEYKEDEDSEGNTVTTKIKSFQYFFQDHDVIIGEDSKEFVFRTNKIKFIDDMNRRLIYDRTIHLLSLKTDEPRDDGTGTIIFSTFKDVVKRTFNGPLKDLNADNISINDTFFNNVLSLNSDGIMVIDVNDNNTVRKATTANDLKTLPLQCGQDIDTGVPSTIYNLYNIGWVNASMIFLNGLAIPWTKTIISVDRIDVFVIVSNLSDSMSEYINDDKEITMEYVYIPFKCAYVVGKENANTFFSQFLTGGKFRSKPAFIIDKNYGGILKAQEADRNSVGRMADYDRVICVDKSIEFTEFYLDEDSTERDKYLADIGFIHNKSLRSFCDGDYRYKLKQFNFMGFQIDPDLKEHTGRSDLLTFKNDDFTVYWHPFNIMDIKFKHLRNNRRFFKIFYNKNVKYDQDNILRIKNKTEFADEYERYRKDITSNINVYINEIYHLAKRDIGNYLVTDKRAFTYGYKYHYITPYETFLIYNELADLLGIDRVTLDEFENGTINVTEIIHEKSSGGGGGGGGHIIDGQYEEYEYVDDFDDDTSDDDIPDPTPTPSEDDEEEHSFIGYKNGAFIIFDDEHNFFDECVSEKTLFDDNGHLRQEIRDFWESFITDESNTVITDFLIPIDNESRDDEISPSDAFYMYEGDSRGKIIPFIKFYNYLAMVPEYPEIETDVLKLRFEIAYLNNIEGGATPIDEFIFYFDNKNVRGFDGYPVVNDFDDRYTANVLNALAWNIFKLDPHSILTGIVKMNYMADYIIPESYTSGDTRDMYIVQANGNPPSDNYEYQKDPRFFYNFGYIDNDRVKRKLASEWALRRNLPEMYFYSLDTDNYTIKSMHLLEEVFDFTYDMTKPYYSGIYTDEFNVKTGANYILGYDADKLEQSIKRSVVSLTKTGAELKRHIHDHPIQTKYTIDSYKMITFVSNNNYKIVFNDVDINAYIGEDSQVSFKYKTEDMTDFETVVGAGDIDCSYKGLLNPLLTINFDNHTFYDIDKDFTATYDPTKTKFNYNTGMLEFYNSSNNLVVTVQIDKLYSSERLEMSRWNISKQENYVMIFKNHKLYEKYNTIEYTGISFSVEMKQEDVSDDDVFEFVFFLNANNTVIEKDVTGSDTETITTQYDSDGNILATETINSSEKIMCTTDLIEPEYLQVLVDKMPADPNDKWRAGDTSNTAYELKFEIESYFTRTLNNGPVRKFECILLKDYKLNGVHRITKEGGGDYIVVYSSTVPAKTDSYVDDASSNHYLPDDRSGLGIGTQAFGNLSDEITINFNGTVEDWDGICRANPITVNGGTVICSNGERTLVEDINATPTAPEPESEPDPDPEEP
jgi:hypothetical protein